MCLGNRSRELSAEREAWETPLPPGVFLTDRLTEHRVRRPPFQALRPRSIPALAGLCSTEELRQPPRSLVDGGPHSGAGGRLEKEPYVQPLSWGPPGGRRGVCCCDELTQDTSTFARLEWGQDEGNRTSLTTFTGVTFPEGSSARLPKLRVLDCRAQKAHFRGLWRGCPRPRPTRSTCGSVHRSDV